MVEVEVEERGVIEDIDEAMVPNSQEERFIGKIRKGGRVRTLVISTGPEVGERCRGMSRIRELR